jgi:hypothetical protein
LQATIVCAGAIPVLQRQLHSEPSKDLTKSSRNSAARLTFWLRTGRILPKILPNDKTGPPHNYLKTRLFLNREVIQAVEIHHPTETAVFSLSATSARN